MAGSPRVTVFIPAFNRENYICTAINSILAQTFTDFEVLVVDDGSTDRTAELVQQYTDPRVRLARNPGNLGIPASRNHGLEKARGEYIALLDSDDFAYSWRLARQVAWLDQHPRIAQVGAWCSLMDGDGRLLKRVRRQPLSPEDVETRLLFHCSLINRTIMARTECLRQLGYSEAFPRCQDYDLHARLAEHYPMANMPEVLVCGREHDGRFTRNSRDLGADRKMAIQGWLLERMGMEANTTDLAWHYNLTQPRHDELPPAREYLAWAEAWLLGLRQANARSERYQPQALVRATAAMWAAACWLNRKDYGRGWAVRLAGSPLARGIPRLLRPYALKIPFTPRPPAPDLQPDPPGV